MTRVTESIHRPLAVVTGAGTGIGRAIAKRLSADFNTILIGRREGPLRDVVIEIGSSSRAYPLDVAKKDDVVAFTHALKDEGTAVSVLVHAAGFTRSGALSQDLDTLWNSWDEVVGTNLSGPFRLTTALAPLLADRTGRVVFLSSIAAKMGGSAGGASIYAASKAGLHGLTVAFAKDFASRGITVNAVAPGYIADTEFSADWPQRRIDDIVAATPVKRVGRPEEIAETVSYLCGPHAGFITGEVVHQNGGWWTGS